MRAFAIARIGSERKGPGTTSTRASHARLMQCTGASEGLPSDGALPIFVV